MIDVENTRGFYSDQEMDDRVKAIPKLKEDLIRDLEEVIEKIKNEEPMPERNINIDDLVRFGDLVDEILNCWYY
jgi:hypothetical protein